jgi:glucose-6-phosphate 1-dehydrogenase
MSNTHSDGFVFFGATGDLAYKKILPSLYAKVKRASLNLPVIGVAKLGVSRRLEPQESSAHRDGDGLGAIPRSQLLHDAAYVRLHGLFGNVQHVSDIAIPVAANDMC